MELCFCRGLNLAHNLQILLLLGFMFCGTGIDYDPSVRLHYHYVDTVRFNCSSQHAFPGQNTSSFRMLQIEHFNETKTRGDIWASIEHDSGKARAVSDTMLKTMGERSVSVSGSINTMSVSWLQLTLFGPDLDMSMRKYGKMSCSVRHTNETGAWTRNETGALTRNKTGPWTSKNITFTPGMRFPVMEEGFVAVNDNAVDLTCLAHIPQVGGSQDATLTITRTDDDVTLASWNRDKNLQCLNNVICSAVHHVNNGNFSVKLRLMEAPERTMHYRCSVQVNGKEYPSDLVQILPDSQSSSDGDHTVTFVGWAIVLFLLGSLSTVVCLRWESIANFVRKKERCRRNNENANGRKLSPFIRSDTANETPTHQSESET